jgi:pilus assembly protein CpaB
MNKRFSVVLLVAFVVALLTALLLYKLIISQASNQPKLATAQVLVAARELGVGTLIRDLDVKVAPWVGAIPKGALSKKEDLIGRGVISTIYQDEPILDGRLAGQGAGAGLAATIPPGMRAVAIRVNEIIGVAGFVVPGQRVDVLISGQPPNSQGSGTLSRTLLQNIEVLSAGQNIQKDAEGKPVSVQVVNLLVTPTQAEVLSLASTETKIQLVLRNPLDQEVVKTPGTAVVSLFSGQKVGAPTLEQPRVRRVVRPAILPVVKERPPVAIEVIQGGRRDTTKFPEENQ